MKHDHTLEEIRMRTRWSAEDIAWVAGVFEGEGTIRIRKGNYGAQVSVRMNDRDVIRRIHAVMGFGNLYEAVCNGKPQYCYQVASAEHVCAFLAAVWRFLGDRRKARAAEALATCRMVSNANLAHPWSPERRARQAATWERKRPASLSSSDLATTSDRAGQRAARSDPGRGQSRPCWSAPVVAARPRSDLR